MSTIKVTLASVPSLLLYKDKNLAQVREACRIAEREAARVLLLPELMLTGHGGHPRMAENAEKVPEGSLAQSIIELSKKHRLCVCVGMAELHRGIVYNSQIVADKGEYIGLQRKINLSHDEYCYFAAGDAVSVFDVGELRFGITICYDNKFPELALIHNLNRVDLILAPHAGRMGSFPYQPWPPSPSPEFIAEGIRKLQATWEMIHRTRAVDNNVYVLLCNAVGSSSEGLEGVVAHHAGTVMAIDPEGKVIHHSPNKDIQPEIATVEIDLERRIRNHGPTRNRRLDAVIRMLQQKTVSQRDNQSVGNEPIS